MIGLTVGVLALVVSAPVEMTPTADSRVRFTAHQTFSTTDGFFSRWTGRFSIDRANVSSSTISVSIDAASIDTDNTSRDDHLRTADFFDVAKHPKITFEATKISVDGDSRAKVTGRLSLHGVTKVVSFSMSMNWKGDVLSAYGQLTIDRYDYGMTYEAPFYAPALKRNVNIMLDVELKPK